MTLPATQVPPGAALASTVTMHDLAAERRRSSIQTQTQWLLLTLASLRGERACVAARLIASQVVASQAGPNCARRLRGNRRALMTVARIRHVRVNGDRAWCVYDKKVVTEQNHSHCDQLTSARAGLWVWRV